MRKSGSEGWVADNLTIKEQYMSEEEVGFGSAIDQIVAEKGISKERVLDTIEAALAAAYRKDYGERGQDVRVEFNEDDGTARVYKVVTVV